MNTQVVIKTLSLVTLLSNIGIVLFVLGLILHKFKIKIDPFKKLLNFFTKNSTLSAFIVSFVATGGSLYLSEIAHFEPCKLCWFQRIFMYPLVIVLGVSLLKKTKDVWRYVIPLSIIGGVVAIYHYYLQVTPSALAPCSTVGISVSCSERPFIHFGYITIPWMSLSAFTLITIAMFLKKRNRV